MSIVFLSLFFTNCKSSQKIVPNQEAAISYKETLRPLMVRSCSPCHFPEEGKKKLLHTYAETKDFIDDILVRVQLAPDEKKYMPFKGKRPALSSEEIQLFKTWVDQGMNQ